jgi:hypothetical protein
VAAVQHTFTNKQHTEYRGRNIHNNKKKKNLEVRAVPRLVSYTLEFALKLRKKLGEVSVRVVESALIYW